MEVWPSSVDCSGWLEQFQYRAAHWRPGHGLRLSVSRLRNALSGFNEKGALLYHPCFSTYFLEGVGSGSAGDDFRDLCILATRHDLDIGLIEVEQELVFQVGGGTTVVLPGFFDPRGSFNWARGSWSQDEGLYFDSTRIWKNRIEQALKVPEDWFEKSGEPDSLSIRSQFEANVKDIARLLPQCWEWVLRVTKVVVPLSGSHLSRLRSGSHPSLPGLIICDSGVGVESLLELIVHETAHHYFYLEEALHHLIVPGHSVRYKSPLRPDPRPLRGIFLACHALCYICKCLVSFALEGGKFEPSNIYRIIQMRDHSYETLLSARGALTTQGLRLLSEIGAVNRQIDLLLK